MSAAKAKSGKDAAPDLLVQAFEIIAETGWRGFSFTELAERAGVSIAEVRKTFDGRHGLMDALNRRLDDAMLAFDPEDMEGLPPKDRVFELMMTRLEAMAPFRAGICRLMHEARFDPGLVLTSACRLDRSLSWLQDVAGLTHGPRSSAFYVIRRRLQRRLLGVAYLQALNVWSSDESSDLAKTMASLDKQLRRIEGLAGLASGSTSGDGAAEAA